MIIWAIVDPEQETVLATYDDLEQAAANRGGGAIVKFCDIVHAVTEGEHRWSIFSREEAGKPWTAQCDLCERTRPSTESEQQTLDQTQVAQTTCVKFTGVVA